MAEDKASRKMNVQGGKKRLCVDAETMQSKTLLHIYIYVHVFPYSTRGIFYLHVVIAVGFFCNRSHSLNCVCVTLL